MKLFEIKPSRMAKNASLKLLLFLSNFLGLIFFCDVPENPLLDQWKAELQHFLISLNVFKNYTKDNFLSENL